MLFSVNIYPTLSEAQNHAGEFDLLQHSIKLNLRDVKENTI